MNGSHKTCHPSAQTLEGIQIARTIFGIGLQRIPESCLSKITFPLVLKVDGWHNSLKHKLRFSNCCSEDCQIMALNYPVRVTITPELVAFESLEPIVYHTRRNSLSWQQQLNPCLNGWHNCSQKHVLLGSHIIFLTSSKQRPLTIFLLSWCRWHSWSAEQSESLRQVSRLSSSGTLESSRHG